MKSAIDEWSIFGSSRPHTLLVGPEAAAAAVMFQHPYLRAPVVEWRPRQGAEPPPATGTLVIRDVHTLDRSQQEQLLAWMDRHAANVQVISLTESPLFPAVLAGAFLETLYYRLNIACIELSSLSESQSARQASLFPATLAEGIFPGPAIVNRPQKPTRRISARGSARKRRQHDGQVELALTP